MSFRFFLADIKCSYWDRPCSREERPPRPSCCSLDDGEDENATEFPEGGGDQNDDAVAGAVEAGPAVVTAAPDLGAAVTEIPAENRQCRRLHLTWSCSPSSTSFSYSGTRS